MTRRFQALLDDAREAGYTITESVGCRYVFKLVGRWQKAIGLVIYEDGTAFCLDVPMSVAKGIRKYNDMRHFLRIPMESAK